MIYVMSFLHLQNVKNLITFFINLMNLIMFKIINMLHHLMVMIFIFIIKVLIKFMVNPL